MKRVEIVGDARQRRIGREQELRIAVVRNVEEENAVLRAQQAQQSAAREDVLVVREVTMMRLVADVAGRRNGYCLEDLPVRLRMLVEIDNGEKVRRDACLIAGPDVERPRLMRVSAELVIVVVSVRARRSGGRQRQHQQERRDNRCPTAMHEALLSSAHVPRDGAPFVATRNSFNCDPLEALPSTLPDTGAHWCARSAAARNARARHGGAGFSPAQLSAPGLNEPVHVHRQQRQMQHQHRLDADEPSVAGERHVACDRDEPKRQHCSHPERREHERGRDIPKRFVIRHWSMASVGKRATCRRRPLKRRRSRKARALRRQR